VFLVFFASFYTPRHKSTLFSRSQTQKYSFSHALEGKKSLGRKNRREKIGKMLGEFLREKSGKNLGKSWGISEGVRITPTQLHPPKRLEIILSLLGRILIFTQAILKLP
jgi:hypothetical protein